MHLKLIVTRSFTLTLFLELRVLELGNDQLQWRGWKQEVSLCDLILFIPSKQILKLINICSRTILHESELVERFTSYF